MIPLALKRLVTHTKDPKDDLKIYTDLEYSKVQQLFLLVGFLFGSFVVIWITQILIKLLSSSSAHKVDRTKLKGKASIKNKHANNKAKFPSINIKPDIIYQELLSMWNTSYTVITFGSAWLFGSTIDVTERIAKKIKAKYKVVSPRSTRKRERCSSTSSFEAESLIQDMEDDQKQQRCSFGCMPILSKVPFSSARRRLSKLFDFNSQLSIDSACECLLDDNDQPSGGKYQRKL